MSARLAKRQLVEPTYWTCPHGVRVRPEQALTYGPEVAEVCDRAGYTPDAQQELGLDLIFAIRPDGSPASFAFCIVCARQNLKSGLFLQSIIGWLFVTEVKEIAWSAHELKTSLDAQTEFFNILEGGSLSRYLPRTLNQGKYDANGKERQELTTGQTVWFQTRTRDGGRGLKKPKVIIDEAFKFKKRAADALIPILLAQYHPQLLYGSSAPPLDDDSEQLRDVMDRGRNHKSPELSYLEWRARKEACKDPFCAHPKDAYDRGLDCALDREHLILEANPTVHRDPEGSPLDSGRITIRTLRNLRQELSPEGYMRECLGWEEEVGEATAVFGPGRWESCAGEPEEWPEHPDAVGVAVSVDRTWASIAAASMVEVLEDPDDPESEPVDRVFTSAVDRREGVTWLIERLQEILARHPDVVIVIDKKGPTNDLLKDFEEADIPVESTTTEEYAEACSRYFDKVRSAQLLHPSSTELNQAVLGAAWRDVGDGRRVWGRRKSASDVSMLEASTLATFGAEKFGSPFNVY